jgi:hypothetical protein
MLLGVSPGRYWVLYVAMIAESSGYVVFTPALQARTPAIVGTGSLLSSANSVTTAPAVITTPLHRDECGARAHRCAPGPHS